MERKIVALLGDTHAGSKLALMPPDITLHDEGPDGQIVELIPEQTASQRYLWELYQGHVRRVMEIAGRDEVVVVHNGDVCQGNRYPVELVSTRVADQIIIGCANLSQWLVHSNVKTMRLTASTGSHAFGEATADILVAEMMQQRYQGASIQAMYHGLMEIGGVTFDVAHHGPYPGSREWLRGNVARLYLVDLMLREIANGNTPPRVVVRSHYHSFVRVEAEVGRYRSVLYVLPSYTLIGDYAHKAARSPDRVTNGLLALEVGEGEILREHRLMETIDIRTREQL